MPQSQYLTGGDLAAYGVAGATTQQVCTASVLVDTYLLRPEGMVWAPDSSGRPGWMVAKDPVLTLHSAGAISPGLNVQVPVVETNVAPMLQPGDVMILDRQSTGPFVGETVVVGSVINGIITLNQVLYAHSGGVTLETGMVIVEERVLPSGRPKSRVAHWPVARMVSGLGRYGFGRRSQGSSGYPLEAFNLLATLQQFGGPPIWEQMDVTHMGIEPEGDFWIPAGILLAYYTRVKLAFVCGWPVGALPSWVKQAVANVIINTGATIGMPPNIKLAKAGDTQLTRWASSNIDEDTKAMIQRYRVRDFA
ncbi:MAG TPA: hypothetical protein VGH91_04490 [Gammaproteobacteria bacterium]|jgi:hypothetical protein